MEKYQDIYYVIDAGNTRIKIVQFQYDKIINIKNFQTNNLHNLREEFSIYKSKKSILSTVLDSRANQFLIQYLTPDCILSKSTPLPIDISDYHTVETLGADRLANVVAAHSFSKTKHSLVIDIGTCIKFDFISDGKYLGGSISPGYQMRYKALHEFTGGLPHLEYEKFDFYIGKSTHQSIFSGVNNGIKEEINGFIRHYEDKYQPLTIFLTGGDHKKIDIPIKSVIFADYNLTVKGLYIILKYNV